MILHATFVQNLLDSFHDEFPTFSFGLREVDGVFYILVPRSFDSIEILERMSLVSALGELMTKLRNAGIKAHIDVTDVL